MPILKLPRTLKWYWPLRNNWRSSTGSSSSKSTRTLSSRISKSGSLKERRNLARKLNELRRLPTIAVFQVSWTKRKTFKRARGIDGKCLKRILRRELSLRSRCSTIGKYKKIMKNRCSVFMNTNRAKMWVALALVVEFEMKSVMLRVKIAAWKSSWQLQEPTRALIWCLSRISMTLTNLWITSRIRDPSLITLISQTSRLRPKGSLPFHVHHLPQASRWNPQTQLKAPRAASNFLR